MSYQELMNSYSELKEVLTLKKDAIIKRNLEQLNKIDEDCKVLCEKIEKLGAQKIVETISDKEKADLKTLLSEIKTLEENNEILIKHSMDVINNILSGILNIAQSSKSAYDSKGKTLGDNESLNISSITEEA